MLSALRSSIPTKTRFKIHCKIIAIIAKYNLETIGREEPLELRVWQIRRARIVD
jgi:hypothetical protein